MSRQANRARGPHGSALSKDSVTPEGRTTEKDEEDNEIGEASPDFQNSFVATNQLRLTRAPQRG